MRLFDPVKDTAIWHYNRHRAASIDDFSKDYNTVSTIKRNISRIGRGGYSDTLIRVTHNQFIIFFNCFGQYAETILLKHIEQSNYTLMYSFVEACNFNINHAKYDLELLEKIKNE